MVNSGGQDGNEPTGAVPTGPRGRAGRLGAARSVALLTSLVLAVFGFATFASAPALAATQEAAEIGAPFAGKWGYNVNVNPPYSDQNSSHPAVHLISGGGDFATDYYGTPGQQVRLRVSNATGNVTFAWAGSSTSCGTSTKVNVFVDGAQVGWIYIAHLVGAVKSGPLTNGMVLGTVGNYSCAPGQHIHVEIKADAGNYACYQDYGHPGTAIQENAKFAGVGATGAAGTRRACGGPVGNPSVAVSNNEGQMAMQLSDFPLGTTYYFCHTGNPGDYPSGGAVPSKGSIQVTSPNQSWASGLCAGSGNFWIGLQATNGQDYFSNQVALGATETGYCEYTDAGNGTPIRAKKGSTFTDSLGSTWRVGQDCSLTIVPPPAPPAPKCVITSFTPRTAVMGVTPITLKTTITTAGCTRTAWRLSADWGEMFITRGTDPNEVIRPTVIPAGLAGHPVNVSAEAVNKDGVSTYRTFAKAFTLKRETTWQSRTFNASPEPVKNGKFITVKGRAVVAAWSAKPSWAPLTGAPVSVQFRTANGAYKTVKTVKTGATGWVSTKVKASKSGYWRVVYSGNAANGSSTVSGDYVKVKK